MRKQRVTQQGIVFGIFVLLFVGFSLFLPGFLTPDNMIALLQNVAVLGILSLGMAIVIIGRGIDLSMIATLAVPPGIDPADGAKRSFGDRVVRRGRSFSPSVSVSPTVG